MLLNLYSGRCVSVFNMGPEDVDIVDIAHALACVNRFGGHARVPVSVAQHSVLVSCLCSSDPLQGLLHDASEAYLGDVVSPLKVLPEWSAYRDIEYHLQALIYRKFGCRAQTRAAVKRADEKAIRIEAAASFIAERLSWTPPLLPLSEGERAEIYDWRPMPWHAAKLAFILRFQELTAAEKQL